MLVLTERWKLSSLPVSALKKTPPHGGAPRAGFLTWREVFDLTHPKRSEDTQHEEAPEFLHRWDNEFRTILNAMPRARSKARTRNMKKRLRYFIVGITNSAPSLTPDGQREVTVLVLV